MLCSDIFWLYHSFQSCHYEKKQNVTDGENKTENNFCGL